MGILNIIKKFQREWKKFAFIFLLFIYNLLVSSDFYVSPLIFSPMESPGKKDKAVIGGTMKQTFPINVDIYPENQQILQRTIPYSQFNYNYGNVSNRVYWDGKNNSGDFVSDGIYTLNFTTFIKQLWLKGNQYLDNRGMFNSPYDVAIGSDGKIYVLDSERIQVFDSNRNYLFSIKNPSYNSPGHWEWASSIVVYGNHIYLMDCGYNQQNIKVFDIYGSFIKSFGKRGTGNGEFKFDWLDNMAVDSNGRIWVVDSGNSRIQVFDTEGNFIFKFGSSGTGDGQFNFTSEGGNIAIDSNGNAYVTDKGTMIGRIQIFSSNGTYQRSIKSAYEGGPAQLIGINGPIAIMGSQNLICVSSYNRNKVVILNNNGTFYTQIGRIDQQQRVWPGRGDGEFQFIVKLKGTSTYLYTVETYDNPRVQIFNSSGGFVGKIGMSSGEFLNPTGLAVGPDGNIYICDYRNAKIEVFNKNGSFIKQIIIPYDESLSVFYLLHPTHIAIDSNKKIYLSGEKTYGGLGLIYIIDENGNLIKSIVPKDSSDNDYQPSGIAVSENYIYICANYPWSSEPSKVFVYNKQGVLQQTIAIASYQEYPYYKYSDIKIYNGKLYILTFSAGPGVLVYNIDGTFITNLSSISEGSYFTINSDRIYVSNYEGNPVTVFDMNGNYIYTFGDCDGDDTDIYIEPQGLSFDGENNLYFSDKFNNRVYKYSLNSNILLGTATCEVDNTKPTAIITYPPHTPANITNNFQVVGTANDKNFESYKVYRDSYLIFNGNSPVSNGILADINLNGLSSGTHTITLIVNDLAENTNTDSIIFFIDNSPPDSNVNPLSPYTKTLSFEVSWTGSDSGSGIAFYDIQYRDGINGQWTDWLISTNLNSSTFTGQDGHTYYFRSRAKDNGGNWESYPSDYDTYTMVDISKPVLIKAVPSNNSYVGANPKITLEISDLSPGSGIDQSSINVQIDGTNRPFNFSNNIITITPTFTKGLHTVVVNFSDRAGNQADTITLTYNALNFQGSLVSIIPDPNPLISEVMIGGEVYRWYKVLDQNNNPATGVTLKIEWNYNGVKSITTDGSDEEGIVSCILKSNEVGSVGQTVTCSIVEAGGNTVNPPVSFQVKILPRSSESEFCFGSGINLKAAAGVGGKLGTKKGLSYKIINTDLQSQSDDKIEIERSFEAEAGVVAEVSAGGGVKNFCYAGAEAGLYASLVMMYTNSFLFDNPYNSDEQQILRSGLIIASLLEETNIPIVSDMLGYVISSFNNLYPVYKIGESFSAGIRTGGNASAGAGFGLGNEENILLGIGVGAGISIESEIMGNLISNFEYENNQLNTTEIGAGVSTSTELDIFAGYQGNVIADKIKAGIGADIANKYELIIFAQPDGTITRAELKVSEKKEWGLEYPGSGPGSTKSTVIILTREQILAIINELVDLLGLRDILQGKNPSSKVILGPDEIKNRFFTLVTGLSNYISQTQLPLAYRIEEEIGDSFGFSPAIKLAAGAEIEAGISLDFEKDVKYVIEEGIINVSSSGLKVYPLAKYEKDNYVPSCEDLEFSTIFDDCVSGIITAMTDLGELVVEIVEEIGDTLVSGVHWVSSTVDDYIPFWKKQYSISKKQLSIGLNEVFSFTPEDVPINHLSSQINSRTIINNGSSVLVIIPGENKGQLTIYYDDTGLTIDDESKLVIYQWDKINRKWTGLNSSKVNIDSNYVYAEIEKLGIFRLGIPVPYGEIILNVNPQDVDLNSPSTITVTSQPIYLVTGEIVPDGTLITVRTQDKFASERKDYGAILTQDEDQSKEGVQISTINGIISFSISSPSKEGSGIIIADSVYGSASGKSYFNVVRNLDTDGNNLPDYWEKTYFGNIGQNKNGDPDRDGLTNLQEYQNRTNPIVFDTDGDGMSDGWEINNNLNPLFDDSNFDPDNDGYKNLIEYQSGTDPHNKNSIPGNKGDLNNDGMTDISDVILCLRQAIGIDQKTPSSADMNNDGDIDISDVILVLRKAIGLD